ncbi:MAG: hypothetical protein GEV04_18665 [Actinophytocola sp.]|nr:hypothetical protein [Actinophytocola sp.]
MATVPTTLSRAVSWHRPLMVFAGLMVVSTVVSLAGLLVDDRVLVGAPIWLKPFKFSISLMVYAVTWAWMLSLQRKVRPWVWWTSTVIAVLAGVEMVVIIGQVVRGEMSHFNVSTSLNAVLFSIMGFSIVLLWALTLVQGVVLLRDRIADRPIALAIRAGVLIALIGMALAALMTGPTPEQLDALRAGEDVTVIGAHSVGVADGGQGLPVTGWSTTGGDLRIPHFVGIHAMQALPLFALGLTAFARRFRPSRVRHEGVRLRLVWVAVGVYAGLLALVTWQALRGQPLLAPDFWTLLAVAALVTATAVGAGTALRAQYVDLPDGVSHRHDVEVVR